MKSDQPTTRGARVFLSYARGDASEIAARLYRDLQARGYDVFWDVEGIRGSQSWAHVLQDEIRRSQVVIALLTPLAVRRAGSPESSDRKDSMCHNEILLAQDESRPVIPVTVIPCCPHFQIYALHRIDMQQWSESENHYQIGLAQLVAAIETALRGERTPFRGKYESLEKLDFCAFLGGRRADFCGRKWVFDRIERWRTDPHGQQALLIKGDPGTGKSTIVAELVHRDPERVLAHFCCQFTYSASREPAKFVQTVAAMIAGKVERYAAWLEVPENLKKVKDPAAECAWQAGILNPLSAMDGPRTGPCLLVIDALDEALSDASAQDTILSLLTSSLRSHFPPWLKIVATTRNHPAVLDRLQGMQAEVIDAESDENRDDVGQYILRRLSAPALADKLAASRLPPKRIVETLLDKSQGNFLYVVQALDDVQKGHHALTRLAALPSGLAEQYEERFERRFPQAAGYTDARLILQAILAGQGPLSPEQIEAACPALDAPLHAVLDRLAGYVVPQAESSQSAEDPRENVGYVLFHKSLADWLTAPPKPPGLPSRFRVSVEHGHAQLATACVQHLQERDSLDDDYFRRHGFHHLLEAGWVKEAIDVLHWLWANRDTLEDDIAARLHWQIALLCNALEETRHDADQARAIDPGKLTELITAGAGEIDPLYSAARVLIDHHIDHWDQIKDSLICCDEFVSRYVVGRALAESYRDFHNQGTKFRLDPPARAGHCRRILEEIDDLYRSHDYDLREAGKYAYKFYYVVNGTEADEPTPTEQFVEELAASFDYNDPMILAELLLDLSLSQPKWDPHDLVKDERFWNPAWPYLQEEVLAIEALRPEHRAEPRVAEARARWRSLEDTAKRLAKSGPMACRRAMAKYRNVTDLLPELRKLEAALRNEAQEKIDEVLRPFLAHPCWEVGEAAASVAARLCRHRPELLELFRRWGRDEDWRVVYSAVDGAYDARHVSGGFAVFDELLCGNFSHANSRVQYICAEDLILCIDECPSCGEEDPACAAVRSMPPRTREGFVERFYPQFEYWLAHANDCALLEDLYQFVRDALADEEQDEDETIALRRQCRTVVERLVRGEVTELLSAGESQWWNLPRTDFLRRIDNLIHTLPAPHFSTRPASGSKPSRSAMPKQDPSP